MFGSIHQLSSRNVVGFSRFALTHSSFSGAAFVIELVSMVAIAIATGLSYHYVFYGAPGSIQNYAAVGSLTGLSYGLAFFIRDEYGIESLLEGRRSPGRLFLVWNLAFVGIAVIGFLTKSTQIFSRAWLVLFYVSGFGTAVLLNAALNRGMSRLIASGWVRRRKLMIVATDLDIAKMEREIEGALDFASWHASRFRTSPMTLRNSIGPSTLRSATRVLSALKTS